MPGCGANCFGCSIATSSSPTVSWVRFRLSQATRKPTPPWMGTVRSAWSLMVSKGRRSSSQRSQCSILAARASSSFRRGVTLGEGMDEDTWLSMFSKMMFRTCGVFSGLPSAFVSPFTSGRSFRSPLYRCSRWSMRSISGFQAASLSASLCCQISSFAGLTAAFLVFIVFSYLRGVPQSFSRYSRPWGSARLKSSHISCVHTAVPAAAVRSTLVLCCTLILWAMASAITRSS